MNTEVQTIINNLQNVLDGNPWYGKPVFEILSAVDETTIFITPNNNSHSLIELLYHMITWADFTGDRIEKKIMGDEVAFNAMDWRIIDPALHSWHSGLAALKASHKRIVLLLAEKEDFFLEEIVDYRKYDFRYLLNGLIQHNIYHLGQIAYLEKLLN